MINLRVDLHFIQLVKWLSCVFTGMTVVPDLHNIQISEMKKNVNMNFIMSILGLYFPDLQNKIMFSTSPNLLFDSIFKYYIELEWSQWTVHSHFFYNLIVD